MFPHRINAANVKKAFSLVEILISLAISAFLLMVFSQQYSNYYLNLNKKKELYQLQQIAHQILDYLKPQIEHIGFLNSSSATSNWHLFATNQHSHLEKHCLIFIYDLNGDGCIGIKNKHKNCVKNNINNTQEIAKEVIGIKLDNQEIYIYDKGNQFEHCIGQECADIFSQCQNDNWHKLTYREQYRVEDLTFEWLKRDRLMKISLQLVSANLPYITYSTQAMIALFNVEGK